MITNKAPAKKKSKKKIDIQVDDGDVAIIISEDGTMQIVLPKIDPVPRYVMMAVAIGILWKTADENFVELLEKQFDKFDKMISKRKEKKKK